MKIYPISSLNCAPSKSTIKIREKLPQQTHIEGNSLALMENYNRGSLLAFKGRRVQEIKEECEQKLERRDFRREHIIDTITFLSNNPKILQVQKEIIDTLLEIPQIGGYNIAEITSSIGDDYKVAQIKRDFISKMAQSGKFVGQNIETIALSLGEDKGLVEYKSQIFDELIGEPNLNGKIISTFYKQIEDYPKELIELEKDFAKFLAQSGLKSGGDPSSALDLHLIIKHLNPINPKVIPIQIDLAHTLIENNHNDAQDIADTIGCISSNEKIGKIQIDFAKTLLQDERFKENSIYKPMFALQFNADENIPLARDLILELLQNKNLEINDVVKIVSYFNLNAQVGQKQIEFMSNLSKKGFFDDPKKLKENIEMANAIREYIVKRPNADMEGIYNYMKQIDFEAIKKLAPLIEKSGYEGRLTFCDYRLRGDRKAEFNKEDLAYQLDLNKLFSDNYFDVDALNDLYSIYPLTKREIGQIPDGWLDKIPNDEKQKAIDEIYQAIKILGEEGYEEVFSEKMGKILGKNVKTEYIGSGAYGMCYKVSVEKSPAICIKTFFETNESGSHGPHFEVQAGYFAGKHSPRFVKMYFGRVAPYDLNDGFIATQFLDDDVEIDENEITDEEKYIVNSADAHERHNMIKGKIFDFGGTWIKDKKTEKEIEGFDIIQAHVNNQTD